MKYENLIFLLLTLGGCSSTHVDEITTFASVSISVGNDNDVGMRIAHIDIKIDGMETYFKLTNKNLPPKGRAKVGDLLILSDGVGIRRANMTVEYENGQKTHRTFAVDIST